MIQSFFTGSRVYGAAKSGSDYDLVVRCSEAEGRYFKEAEEVASPLPIRTGCSYGSTPKHEPVRIGPLNLILCYTDEVFEGWRKAAEVCQLRSQELGRPLTRDEAIAIHKLWRV